MAGMHAFNAPGTRSSAGVRAPRNVIRHPRLPSAIPNIISGMSCSSSGGHASNARGPTPSSQPRASPPSRRRIKWLAKCSCATESRPCSQSWPISRRAGRNTERMTVSASNSMRRWSIVAMRLCLVVGQERAPKRAQSRPSNKKAQPPGASASAGPRRHPLRRLACRHALGQQPLHRRDARDNRRLSRA